MALWHVRRRFRHLTSRRGDPGPVARTEAWSAVERQVLEALLTADRLETELSVLHVILRCHGARLRRGLALLDRSHHPAPELKPPLEALRRQLAQLEARAAQAREQLDRVSALATGHAAHLELLRLGPSASP